MSEGTKARVLVGLVLFWLILMAFRILSDSEPERVALKFTSGQTAAVPGATSRSTLVQPPSGKLKAGDVPANPSKNIFAPLEFSKPKTKKVRKQRKPPPTAARRAPPPQPSRPSPEELAAAQARTQMAQYRVLGYSTDGGDTRAFLGKGRKIFIAGVGETVEGQIEIAAITETAVKLRETRTNLEATLPYKQ